VSAGSVVATSSVAGVLDEGAVAGGEVVAA